MPHKFMSKIIEISMTQGKIAIIDAEDGKKVLPYKWTTLKIYNRKREMFYARRTVRLESGKQKTVLLHRFILDAPHGLEVDHINGDSLDNRRCNLRLATVSQNSCNAQRLANKTGFRGVTKQWGKFYSRIVFQGKRFHLGSYFTAEEAALAYDSKAVELHKEFAALNFPAQN